MKYLFHLGHPAHFHLFKNTIKELNQHGHKTLIVIKKKDVLEDLLRNAGFEFVNILPQGRKDSKIHIAIGQLKQDVKLFRIALQFKPDMLIGTSVAISHVGKILNIPSINLNEDDAEIVPLYAKLAYPWATKIIAPEVCSVGKWKSKKIAYNGYHELAYLHPNNFSSSQEIASKYVDTSEKYFILRFAKLTAHHDEGVKGISSAIAEKIIQKLSAHGKIYLTSERALEPEFEKYRIQIDPIDMHHVMAFAHIYLGDSQTMAAEAGVLGVPFIRFNDFVGRISYLSELENKYHLGFGILPSEEFKIYEILEQLLTMPNLKETFLERRAKMLSECIDLARFLTDFLENYKSNKK